jgi:hypothetical protein
MNKAIRKWLKKAIIWEKNVEKQEKIASQLMKLYGWR